MSISSVKTGAVGVSLLAGNTAYDPAATWLIQRVNGTGSSNTITFSSIPGTYQHLQIRIMARDTGTAFNQGDLSVGLRFNNDSGNNYVRHRLFGNGTSALTNVDTGISNIYNVCDMTTDAVAANIMGVGIVDIHDYASTTKNKTTRSFTGANSNTTATEFKVALNSGLWISTSAVNRIDLINVYNNFTSNSTFALYGFIGA